MDIFQDKFKLRITHKYQNIKIKAFILTYIIMPIFIMLKDEIEVEIELLVVGILQMVLNQVEEFLKQLIQEN